LIQPLLAFVAATFSVPHRVNEEDEEDEEVVNLVDVVAVVVVVVPNVVVVVVVVAVVNLVDVVGIDPVYWHEHNWLMVYFLDLHRQNCYDPVLDGMPSLRDDLDVKSSAFQVDENYVMCQ
jgi:hypothetical protein